jgi:electron transport complex protein RnfG
MKNNYLGQAWLVITLALCFGGALAGVESALSDRIKANKLAKTQSKIPELVPGAERGEPDDIGGLLVYRAVAQDKQVGWVIPGSGPGFADRIELLIGLNVDAEVITGLAVLDQKETPGLGNKIEGPEWREQFRGKKATESLNVSKGSIVANGILPISGATISSRSICAIVNRAVAEFREQLARETSKD